MWLNLVVETIGWFAIGYWGSGAILWVVIRIVTEWKR